jgi:hypothetical protein
MIPNLTGIITKFLEHIEADIDKAGWDRHPGLFLLQRVDEEPGQPGADFMVTATQLEVPFAGNTIAGLGEFAVYLAAPGADLSEISDGFVGLAFICESWGWRNENQAPDPGRSLADQPGAVECRQVTAIDTTGTMHVILRIRSETPRTDIFAPDAAEAPTGTMIDAIRLAVAAIADALPPGSHQLPTVADLIVGRLRPGPARPGDAGCTCGHWASRHIRRTNGKLEGACADTDNSRRCECPSFDDGTPPAADTPRDAEPATTDADSKEPTR